MDRIFNISGQRLVIGEATTTSQLAAAYNVVADVLGEKVVNRFSDKTAGLKRTLAILERAVAEDRAHEGEFPAPVAAPQPEPVAEVAPTPASKAKAAPKPKGERATRVMRFNFPVTDGIRSVRDTDSLRGQAVALLTEGATFEQVKALVDQFDGNRGSTPGNLERRSYELVRIMHYYLGYGITHNMETGVIRLRTR